MNNYKNYDSIPLLENFNNRELSSFGDVYTLLFTDLSHFASKVFYDSVVESEDVIQDIFINIWENRTKKFDSILGIKMYIYVCIKNKLKTHINHSKYVDTYNKSILNDDYFVIQVAETEKLSIISQAIDILPSECAKVFKLHLDGWEVKDISKELCKSESTVYKQKQEAIRILKIKFPHNKVLLLLINHL